MWGNPDIRATGNRAQRHAGKYRRHPPQNCALNGDLDHYLIHGSLGPSESTSRTASWSVQKLLQRSWLRLINRPTKRPWYSICSNRPHSLVLWLGLIMITITVIIINIMITSTPHHNRFTALFRDHPGEPVPEENFWTLWCKGRLTEADTLTIRLGATPSRLTSANLHHPSIFSQTRCPSCHPTNSVKALKATSAFGLGRRR